MDDLDKYHEEQMAKDPEYAAAYRALQPEYDIIDALITARAEGNLTQRELAERCGMRQSALARIESGNANPTLKTLKQLAEGMERSCASRSCDAAPSRDLLRRGRRAVSCAVRAEPCGDTLARPARRGTSRRPCKAFLRPAPCPRAFPGRADSAPLPAKIVYAYVCRARTARRARRSAPSPHTLINHRGSRVNEDGPREAAGKTGGNRVKLVVTEKNDAAQKIADLLGAKKPKADKVYSTPVYRFEVDGEEWVTIGLRGHILEPDFTPAMVYKKRGGWQGVTEEGETYPAELPDALPKPPFKKKKPFTEDGVELKSWKMDALPYLVYAPIKKLPKEKEIIRSLKNLAKKADSVVIATDFDREGELIGSDALSCIREVNPKAPVSRARYSAFTKEEIAHAFGNLVAVDDNLASAGASRQDIDLIWGAVLTRYLTLVKFAGYGNVRSSGRVQTPTLALIVARERERLAFVPEDYWVIKGAFDADAQAGPTSGEGPGAFEAPHATARFKKEAEAAAAMARVEGAASAMVSSIEKRKRTVAPPAPFNTTSLMAAASAEGLSPARTMRIAESLYMDGYISYPRVDNTVYPSSLDLAETVRAISGNPAYAPYCKNCWRRASSPPRAARRRRPTTRPSTPRPRPRPTIWRPPTTSCTTSSRGASWPRCRRPPSWRARR